MARPSRPISELFTLLKTLDGRPYQNYGKLNRRSYSHHRFDLRLIHIQGSPGAFPASLCCLVLKTPTLGLDQRLIANRARRLAAADYLLRMLYQAMRSNCRSNRGAQGSGSYQPLELPPQVLARNLVEIDASQVRVTFQISLPGSHDNRILGRQAVEMFGQELDLIVEHLMSTVQPDTRLVRHCDVVEDMVVLQSRLAGLGLVAFVGDGAVLARHSGVSHAPLREGAVRFSSPDAMAVEVDLPNAGRVRGLGIPPGITVLVGGAFHGKTTLLEALAKSIYPHVPGDGRECVIACPEAVFVTAEQGRAVNGLNISGFIRNMPSQANVKRFRTQNASGSTSQAAGIIEAVQAGAKLLLMDEDSSATNFLFKDPIIRRLLGEDTITPYFDRIREFYDRFGVSTLIVVGASSAYMGVAHHILAMQNYQPVCMTERVEKLTLPEPHEPSEPIDITDNRQLTADNFDPSYHASRLGKRLPVRIKPLRLQERVLEYGNQQLDLTCLKALVDAPQILAIGYALLLARNRFGQAMLSPSQLAKSLSCVIDEEGLQSLLPEGVPHHSLARPRRLELAAAINRLRNLKVSSLD